MQDLLDLHLMLLDQKDQLEHRVIQVILDLRVHQVQILLYQDPLDLQVEWAQQVLLVVQLVLQDYKETMAQQDQLAQLVEACRVSRVQQDLLAHVASKVMQVLRVQLQMSQDQLVLQVLLEQDLLAQEDLKVTQESQDQLAHQEQVLQVIKDLAELKVK
jgi:hypothetical protein